LCLELLDLLQEICRLAAGLTAVALAGIFIVANLGICIWQTGLP